MLKDISDIVKDTRKALKLSQKELADLAGVGKTAVWDLENKAVNTKIQTLDKILAVLNINVEFIKPFTPHKED